jgi:hypothetical protein
MAPSCWRASGRRPRRWPGEFLGLLDRCQSHVVAGDVLVSRLCLALEELAEWGEAHAAGDPVAAADAWGDRMYTARGQNCPIVERNSFRLYRSKRNEFRSTFETQPDKPDRGRYTCCWAMPWLPGCPPSGFWTKSTART